MPATQTTDPRNAQRMKALDRANQVRLGRAQIKRDVFAGRRRIAELLLEPPAEIEDMVLSELLRAQHRWGRTRTRKLLSRVSIGELRRIGALTDRQRGELSRELA